MILKKYHIPILKILLLIVSTSVFLVLVDRLLGLVVKHEQAKEMDFNPLTANITLEYNSMEFTSIARTNAFGLRDRDFDLNAPHNVIRILAIGDSFTYGWGVGDAEAWPKQLETYLQNKIKGKRLEVINAGRPGYSPREYLMIAKELIPKFKPDIVLVGVVEGDDIGQLAPWIPDISESTSKGEEMRRELKKGITPRYIINSIDLVLQKLYPNFYTIAAKHNRLKISPVWVKNFSLIIDSSDDKKLERLMSIDKKILSFFATGGLNPSIL